MTTITQYRQAIAQFLSTQTAAIDPTFTDWQYFRDAIAPSDPPKGSVYIPRLSGTIGATAGYSRPTYSARLRILIGDPSEQTALENVERWADLLLVDAHPSKPSILSQLSKDGIIIDGVRSLSGFHLVGDAAIDVRPNQDGGAIAGWVATFSFSS